MICFPLFSMERNLSQLSFSSINLMRFSFPSSFQQQKFIFSLFPINFRLNISNRQQEEFVHIFILALKSVVKLDESTIIALIGRMRALDTELINPAASGCPFGEIFLFIFL